MNSERIEQIDELVEGLLGTQGEFAHLVVAMREIVEFARTSRAFIDAQRDVIRPTDRSVVVLTMEDPDLIMNPSGAAILETFAPAQIVVLTNGVKVQDLSDADLLQCGLARVAQEVLDAAAPPT